jgi:signal transduction histidine kinase
MAQPAALPDNDDISPAVATLRSSARARRQAALDEQQRSFLRMVSHELRTPLNSILGFSEIISQELYGPLGAPQYKEYAGIIRASGQRLLNLVNQILEIARLEGRAMDLDRGSRLWTTPWTTPWMACATRSPIVARWWWSATKAPCPR